MYKFTCNRIPRFHVFILDQLHVRGHQAGRNDAVNSVVDGLV